MLVRVVLGDGRLDVGRTLPGRGAWLCAGSPACVDQAAKRKAFDRAFRTQVEPDTVRSLRAALADRARMEADEETKTKR